MNLSVSNKINFVLISAVILAGCGGDDINHDSTSTPGTSSPVGKVLVANAFDTVQPNQVSRVDFSQYIRGQGAILASVTSNRPECFVSQPQGMTAEVKITGAALCQYKFTARNSVNEAAGQLNMLATLAATPELEPLSHTMQLGDSEVVFDLTALYGSELPAGYELVANSVVVQGGEEQGTAQVQGSNSILYTPPDKADWDQIVYVLHNPAQPDQDIFGSIFVTVSERSNQPPQISNKKYDYNEQTAQKVIAFDSHTIDLAALTGLAITDPDGHEWQLVEVNSYSATVAAVDPNDVTNKKFTFITPTVGQHIISYVIADHYGGYTSGMIRVVVSSKEFDKNWSDLNVTNGSVFSAPPLYSEASHQSVTAVASWDYGVNNTIASFNASSAIAYCGGRGRLPWLSEMYDLISEHQLGGLGLWPQEKSYLVYDSIGYKVVDISQPLGPIPIGMSYIPSEKYYVTCVSNESAFISMDSDIIANGEFKTIGIIEKSSLSGVNIEFEPSVGTLTDVEVSVTVEPIQGSNNVSLRAKSKKIGTAQFKISIDSTNESFTTPLINFLVDDSTVTLKKDTDQTGITTVSEATVPDGRVGENTLTRYLLTDVNDNPKSSSAITVTLINGTDYATIIEPLGQPDMASGLTDINGKLVVKTKSRLGGGVSADINVDAGIFGSITDSLEYKYATLNNIERPNNNLYVYTDAEALCKSLSAFHRLPNHLELSKIFIQATQADAEGDHSQQLCDVYGWPLDNQCGGTSDIYWAHGWSNYDVVKIPSSTNMINGINSRGDDPLLLKHAACLEAPKASDYYPVDTTLRTYFEAMEYCESLPPEGTYRLPKLEDLQLLWLEASGGVAYTGNMCNIYGWPLDGRYNPACGGAATQNTDWYWTYAERDSPEYSGIRFSMDRGLHQNVSESSISSTACVKKGYLDN